MFSNGKEVTARIHNVAINAAAVEFTFKDSDGVTHVFVAGERILITDVLLNNRATAKDITIFQDADGDDAYDAGEELVSVSFAAAGFEQVIFDSENGLPSRKINAALTNTLFALASAAGSVDILVKAVIVRA